MFPARSGLRGVAPLGLVLLQIFSISLKVEGLLPLTLPVIYPPTFTPPPPLTHNHTSSPPLLA
jgi:hypothetical protein